MSCCLNPDCQSPENQKGSKFCQHCGSPIPELLIERFQVLKVIGQGGFGRTYLALDRQKLDEQCVLKQLIFQSKENSIAGRAESMFYAEAKQLQTLGRHPQIPALYAFFIHNANQYLVQEWIQGETLKQELTHGTFSERKIRQLLSNILPVLAFIHRQHVIHRDIKPENIMRHQQTGKLMLIDFGISKTFCLETLTKTGTIVGSHGYSSKEQIMEGKTSPATDLFSLGVSCFHLMTQVSPLELSVDYGFSWIEQWRSHVSQPMTPAFAALMDQLVAVSVRDRYDSAEAVLQDLKHLPEPPTEVSRPQLPTGPSDPTQPMEHDPFITWNSASPIGTVNQTRDRPILQRILSRRKLLTFFGMATVGTIGGLSLWRLLGGTDNGVLTSVRPIRLTGRMDVVGQFETLTVDRNGQTSAPTLLVVDLIREDLGQGAFLDLVKIPAGTFQMGSPAAEAERDEDESPRHAVTLPSFLIGVYEITQKQWQAVAQMPMINVDMRQDDSTFKGFNRPVERVTWDEAVEFCQRLSRQTGHRYRLPSEAEWEYACRAGTTTAFTYGTTVTSGVANFDANSAYGPAQPGEFRKKTTEVGGFYANAWGLYDMHGNVLEWCADYWHRSYDNAPTDGTAWIRGGDETLRVLRGGSWIDPPRILRSANRSKKHPQVRNGDVGFRVVCEISA